MRKHCTEASGGSRALWLLGQCSSCLEAPGPFIINYPDKGFPQFSLSLVEFGYSGVNLP